MPVGFNTNTQAAKAVFKVEPRRRRQGGREGETKPWLLHGDMDHGSHTHATQNTRARTHTLVARRTRQYARQASDSYWERWDYLSVSISDPTRGAISRLLCLKSGGIRHFSCLPVTP